MLSSSEYASVMEMDEVLVQHFLAGSEDTAEDNFDSLLRLKALLEPLDLKDARDVIFRNSGNRPATIECLRKLERARSDKTAMNDGKERAHEIDKRVFFGWLFKKKTKPTASIPSHKETSNNFSHHDTPLRPEVVEDTPPHTLPHEVREVPVPKEKLQDVRQALVARPFIRRTLEEDLSKEYNFASQPNDASSLQSDFGEEFQKIFNQFVQSV
ncbi:hypothetical protein TraAM80_04657 [Trypanosoma rangeli]|uniref:Uncharacterized protein n=1 Tax=Trypanosoma rangeli TaxID=5698 RepID=A0A422NIE6_TRYRA|nr:uncharacterized protein TraAM80_04657 [Trypanosoma rangeli]RNF05246.1 hypothetical protein TraAM80_04657 [Trypanosoma rangeli]|eukprot:RNF05246.1 hypothetical protein TraAM80_04657 [Trypanosoma rangeli]